MKQEIMQKWVEALRSGEYAQTKYRLRTEKGFCCLGVLTDLYAKEVGGEWEENSCNADGEVGYTYSDSIVLLADDVKSWSGVRRGTGVYDEEENSLAMRNDEGYSFEEIADIISEKWEEL